MHVIYNFLIKQSEHPRTHELEMRPYNSASRLYINEGRSDELKMYLEIRPQQFTLCGAGWKNWGHIVGRNECKSRESSIQPQSHCKPALSQASSVRVISFVFSDVTVLASRRAADFDPLRRSARVVQWFDFAGVRKRLLLESAGRRPRLRVSNFPSVWRPRHFARIRSRTGLIRKARFWIREW